MLDKDIVEHIRKSLTNAAWRGIGDSSKIAPSYACWDNFLCQVEVHKLSDFKWFALQKAEA